MITLFLSYPGIAVNVLYIDPNLGVIEGVNLCQIGMGSVI
jgi:hypothetical protein